MLRGTFFQWAFRFTVIVLLCAIFSVTGASPGSKENQSSRQGANLVKNPGFEEDNDRDGTPDGWYLCNGHRANNLRMAYVIDRNVFHRGKASMLFFSGRKVANDGLAQDVLVEQGKTYQFRAWIRREDMKAFSQESPTRIILTMLDAEGKGTDSAYNMDVWLKKDREWEKVEKDIVVPESARSIRIWIFMSQSTGWGWFDDIEVRCVVDKENIFSTP